MAPGVNTFSRAKAHWRTSGGPRPLRSLQYVLGFPWLSDKDRSTVEEANFTVFKSFEICCIRNDFLKPFLLEHPEQLGVVNDFVPASIWDFDEFKQLLLRDGVQTAAFFQCQWEAASSKPTRFVWGSTDFTDATLFAGVPQLDAHSRYRGPLPPSCGHRHEVRLLGKDSANTWAYLGVCLSCLSSAHVRLAGQEHAASLSR